MAQNLVQRIHGYKRGEIPVGTGFAIGLALLGAGLATYLYGVGTAEIEKAKQPRYQTIQEITKQYAGKMSPEAFRQYIVDLGLAGPK